MDEAALDAATAAHRMFGKMPWWIRALMAARNGLVAPFGLKTGPCSLLGAVTPEHAGEPVPGVRLAGRHGEKGKQGLGLLAGRRAGNAGKRKGSKECQTELGHGAIHPPRSVLFSIRRRAPSKRS
jgi:hypothetical protein